MGATSMISSMNQLYNIFVNLQTELIHSKRVWLVEGLQSDSASLLAIDDKNLDTKHDECF